MGRNPSGVYSLPAGSTVVNGDTSDAADVNTPFADLEADMNTARPIVAGGTGATTAAAARTNLEVAGSFQNKIINGNFSANQRAKSGTVTLAAGEYGHDRWKGGSSGCTYTFAKSANITTITITAGSLVQTIKGSKLQSGTHALSWTGTASGKIGAGGFSASGVTGTATGGTNLDIEFNTGTLSLVQFEKQAFATEFEFIGDNAELDRCKDYFRRITGTAEAGVAAGLVTSATLFRFALTIPPMIGTPAVTLGGTLRVYDSVGVNNVSSLNTVKASVDNDQIYIFLNASGMTAGGAFLFTEIGVTNYLDLDAEI